jgi:hypothetical protein
MFSSEVFCPNAFIFGKMIGRVVLLIFIFGRVVLLIFILSRYFDLINFVGVMGL